MKLEHQIRDRPFILKTDNKNLTFLNTSHRKKSKDGRSLYSIQHYDFQVLHIPRVENIEADAFSRLIKRPTKEEFEQKPLPPMKPQVYQRIKAVHGNQFGHGGIQKKLLIC